MQGKILVVVIFVISIVALYAVSYERSFNADQFLLKDHDLKITHERNI